MRTAVSRWMVAALALAAASLIALGCGSDSEDGAAADSGGDDSEKVIRLAFPSTGLDDLPIWPAIESLEQQGITVETREFAEQEDIVVAMTEGEIDVAVNMATPTIISGVEQGAPIKIISSYTKNSQILVARNGLEGAEALEGKRIGVHSEASFTKALADYYQQENGIEANVLIVPGSENRAQALGKEQLDASVISITDFATLNEQYPDTAHVEQAFVDTLPDLIAFTVAAPDEWLDAEPELATAFVQALVDGSRTIGGDLDTALEYGREHYSDFSPTPELLEEGVRLLVEGGYFPDDGMMTPETCTQSIEFLISVNQIEGLESVEDDGKYCRYDMLEEALANLG